MPSTHPTSPTNPQKDIEMYNMARSESSESLKKSQTSTKIKPVDHRIHNFSKGFKKIYERTKSWGSSALQELRHQSELSIENAQKQIHSLFKKAQKENLSIEELERGVDKVLKRCKTDELVEQAIQNIKKIIDQAEINKSIKELLKNLPPREQEKILSKINEYIQSKTIEEMLGNMPAEQQQEIINKVKDIIKKE